jgi:hypothetical protein
MTTCTFVQKNKQKYCGAFFYWKHQEQILLYFITKVNLDILISQTINIWSTTVLISQITVLCAEGPLAFAVVKPLTAEKI